MALYNSKGTISDMSEVQTGQSKSGNQWQRMTITMDIPGINGSVTKQVFSVFGDKVNEVLLFSLGDKVEVTWSMYAREWQGRWYNNVELYNISRQEGNAAAPAPKAEPKVKPAPADPDGDLPF